MTLNGLERELIAHFGAKFGIGKAKKLKVTKKLKVNVVRYADDFVVTGDSKEMLEQEVRPWIEAFLEIRGLQLSEEKTRIVRIDEGFDFLGWNFRKYSGTLLIKPSRKNVQTFYRKVADTYQRSQSGKAGGVDPIAKSDATRLGAISQPCISQAGV